MCIATALAPPFLVMLSRQGDPAQPGDPGLRLVASALAAIFSPHIRGRLPDRSSRRVLARAGVIAAAATGFAMGWIGGPALAAVFIFTARIACEGAAPGARPI